MRRRTSVCPRAFSAGRPWTASRPRRASSSMRRSSLCVRLGCTTSMPLLTRPRAPSGSLTFTAGCLLRCVGAWRRNGIFFSRGPVCEGHDLVRVGQLLLEDDRQGSQLQADVLGALPLPAGAAPAVMLLPMKLCSDDPRVGSCLPAFCTTSTRELSFRTAAAPSRRGGRSLSCCCQCSCVLTTGPLLSLPL